MSSDRKPFAQEPGLLADDDIADVLSEQAEALQQLATELRQRPLRGDWVDAGDADMMSSDEVGIVIAKSADTAVRWFEAAFAAGFPLGIRRAGVCLFSLRRLLIWVERRKGLPARLACASRAQKLMEMRAERQKREQIDLDAAIAAS